MFSSGSFPLKSSPVTLIESINGFLKKLIIRLARQVLVQVVQRIVVQPERFKRRGDIDADRPTRRCGAAAFGCTI
jgi:hypothetical protein